MGDGTGNQGHTHIWLEIGPKEAAERLLELDRQYREAPEALRESDPEGYEFMERLYTEFNLREIRRLTGPDQSGWER